MYTYIHMYVCRNEEIEKAIRVRLVESITLFTIRMGIIVIITCIVVIIITIVFIFYMLNAFSNYVCTT